MTEIAQKRQRGVFIELDAERTAKLEQLAKKEARSFRKQALKCLEIGMELLTQPERRGSETPQG